MQTRTKQNRTNKVTPKPIKMRFPTDSVWNLKALFASQKQAQGACIKAQNACKHFAKTYESKLHTLAPKEFEIAIKEYENLCENLGRIMTYAFLLFAQDTTNGSIYAEFEHKVNKAQNDIVFFEYLNRHFAAVRLGPVKSSSHGNPYDEMTFDYHIYSML